MNRPDRIALIHGSLIIFAVAIVGRAAQVQLWQRAAWMAKAERQHFADSKMLAARGNIFDVSGVTLAQTSEFVRLSIAPREVKDRRVLARDLRRLGVDGATIARAIDTSHKWMTIPKHFLPSDVESVSGIQGVYRRPFTQRDYTPRYATRRILGRVDEGGKAIDGIELALDSVLRGQNGRAMLLRDARGARPQSPSDTAVVPRAGEDVVLTLSQDLQEIAERALNDAVDRGGASGGDILIMDPYSGEIRALASIRRDPRSSGSPLVSEPFEPGSTLKPFVAAALLSRGRARPDEMMELGDGTWTVEGRTIHDEHKAPRFSLSDVIRYSSNVGIAKFAQRLSHAEQYQALRDFGFGTATGISLPAEASGLLRPPEKWSKQSPVSLAIGYEISVTALQLATAYAALANGGELLEPTIVKEIRGPDGVVRYTHTRRVVRRVIDPSVASTVRQMLLGAVEGGTADEAGLGNFQVAGKTGTAKRTINGHYRDSSYTPSFVGLFPADRPQYVILVKIDHPTVGSIFGGHTAAPVSKVV
ncbi:MAG: penicillin-binding protein 2, partial [Gemmatimonadota bacterium]|nr:penicillin-binding protein 2 [Gemmatimonadota bacterium]